MSDYKSILVNQEQGVLHITFNRPEARNAMSLDLLNELVEVVESVKDDRSVRAIVLRGAGANFCAGGDIKDMARARAATQTADHDPIAVFSRRFGEMLHVVNQAPQATIAMLEGAVLGGGFGLACVTDVAIARDNANFGLPETGLGIPPAQIAPFVVERIGLTQARRLGVCGGRFDGYEAARLGLVHFVGESDMEINATLDGVLQKIRRCAPGANAITKQIMLEVQRRDRNDLLDDAAQWFADCLRSDEGQEGTTAFIQKRKPNWVE